MSSNERDTVVTPPKEEKPSSGGGASKWLRPRMEWLLVFVPIAVVLEFTHGAAHRDLRRPRL